jgi:hypothetical protein
MSLLSLASDTSLEDTQASYTERLRQKSRSITMNGNQSSHDWHSHMKRSMSKDALNDDLCRSQTQLQVTDLSMNNEQHLRTKSIGHLTSIVSNSSDAFTEQISHDFQTKREFFENRTYIDRTSSNHSFVVPSTCTSTIKPRVYTLYPTHSPMIVTNNTNHGLSQSTTVNPNQSHHVTR